MECVNNFISVLYWVSFKAYLPRIYVCGVYVLHEFYLDTGKGDWKKAEQENENENEEEEDVGKEEEEEKREQIHYCCRFYFTLY